MGAKQKGLMLIAKKRTEETRSYFKTSFEPILRTFVQKRLAKRSVKTLNCLRALARVFKV